jgi:phosphonate transport system substrate-binding protein
VRKSGVFMIAVAALVGVGGVIAYQNAPYRPNSSEKSGYPEESNAKNGVSGATDENLATLRLGIIPERDVYQQRKAYLQLAEYLHTKDLGGPPGGKVEVLTASSYAGTLKDLEEGQVDAAFVGSLIAVLAQDRCGAAVVLKSEELDGRSTYAGAVFVREDSPAQKFEDLMGKRIGGVKTTTAGAVYPLYRIRELGWQARDVPSLVWSGTHDDVIREVLSGSVDAGAVKDLRLDAYRKEHPEAKLRTLSISGRVPNNALVLRKDLPAAKQEKLVTALLGMDRDAAGAAALAALGYRRFLRTSIEEYGPLYDMIDVIGPLWFALDVGAAPKRGGQGDKETGGQGDKGTSAMRTTAAGEGTANREMGVPGKGGG